MGAHKATVNKRIAVPSDKKEKSYSVGSVLIALDYIYSQGGDAEGWLTEKGIDLSALNKANSRIDHQHYTTIWETLRLY